MKSKLLLILIFLLVMPFLVNAGIIVNPLNVGTDAYVGLSTPIELNIFNNGSYPISALSVDGSKYTTVQSLNTPIQFNESRKIFILIKPNQTGSLTDNIKINFVYQDNVQRDPKTWIQDLTSFSYPSFQIKQGDSVIFRNTDDKDHTVTSPSANFDELIHSLKSSAPKIYNNIGTFDYYDKNSSLGGKVTVIDKNQPANIINPADSVDMQININAKQPATNIEVKLYDTNLTISNSGTHDSALSVQNTGNSTATKIHLSDNMNWIKFQDNDFDLSAGTNKVIPFTILPIVNRTEDTNKTYQVAISAFGSNAGSIAPSIMEVNIPYSVVNLSNEDISKGFELTVQLLTFCADDSNFVNSQLCQLVKKKITNTEYVYKNSTINVNDGTMQSFNDHLVSIDTDNHNFLGIFKKTQDDDSVWKQNITERLFNVETSTSDIANKSNYRFYLELVFIIIFVTVSIVNIIDRRNPKLKDAM